MVSSRSHAYGALLVTAAAVLWSSAGLFVRYLDMDVWTMQAWRALFGALSLLVLVVYEHGSRAPAALFAVGRAGIVAVPVTVLSMLTYICALKLTTVANVLAVYATVPFVAAAVGFLWLSERVERRTLLASAIALAGIAVMAGGATRPDDIAGTALAALMTVMVAVMLVMVRRYPAMPMAQVNALAAGLCSALCFALAPGIVPSAFELLVLAVFGLVTTALAYLLFLTGARYIPSSEAGLISLLDIVMGPAFVWLAFGENPGLAAILGGVIVLASLIWYFSAGLRRTAAA